MLTKLAEVSYVCINDKEGRASHKCLNQGPQLPCYATDRGATKGGLEGAQAPPSLKKVCLVIRPDPTTFLLGGGWYLHLLYYEHFRYFTIALTNSPVSDYQRACISKFIDS